MLSPHREQIPPEPGFGDGVSTQMDVDKRFSPMDRKHTATKTKVSFECAAGQGFPKIGWEKDNVPK